MDWNSVLGIDNETKDSFGYYTLPRGCCLVYYLHDFKNPEV